VEGSHVIDLTIQGLTWCWRHGHPIIGLRAVDGEELFWITLSPEDAQALSPLYQGQASGRARIYALLETLVERLNGQITAVRLEYGAWNNLEATLEVEGPSGKQTIPVHVIDAVILASRPGVPFQISELDLTRIREERPTAARDRPSDTPVAQAIEVTLEPFRRFIESLDLGQLDDLGRG
jgi:bifunctional DNase/RNase